MAFSLIVSRGCPNYSVNNRIRVKMSLPFAICIVAFLAAGVNGANETTGILTSPGYPDAYTRGTRTTAIELPNPNATVLLQFQKLDLTATGYTSSTFFRIHDGLNTSDRVLNIYSSNEYYTAKDVESTGNKMLIYFSAYHTGAPGSGYYATYSTVDRHDNIILETGSITSPGYPAKNTDAVAIHWTLTQPNSDFVRVEIEDLELNEDSDSLTIRDGPLAGSPILGQLSGVKNQTHHTFLSYRNSTFLRYVSNGLSTGRGFNATFHPGYRYRLTGSASGEVASKNFPSNYSTYLAEEWVINLPAGNMSVLLEFKCFHTDTDDVLTIRDGDSYLSPIIGVYSGNDLPPNILAYNNRLTVSFVSYGGATNKGFYATYRSVNRADYTTTTTPAPTTAEHLTCVEPGVYRIPYPGVCEKYYQCVNFNAYEGTCAPGLFFDSSISECNLADRVECPWFNRCPPEGIFYLPVSGDCSAYIMCVEGEPFPHRCANGTSFDPVDLRCELSEDVTCA